MKNKLFSPFKQFIAAVSLLAIGLQATPVVSAQTSPQPGPVDITIGRPSIWTLAQAHYLLAKMHKEDRAWKLVTLGDLDPNAINRQRVEVLQTLLGITADFDAGAGLKNRFLQERYETNYSRQQTVRSDVDRRSNDLIQANRELYYINVELTRLKEAKPPDADAIKAKTDELNAKTVERDAINSRISTLNTELNNLIAEDINKNVPSMTAPFASSTQPTPVPLTNKLSNLIDKNFLDAIYKDTANKSSQLQASTRLDNHIQMQYELISKQLTLLRDEVGDKQRVIFLELPSSIYSVPKMADKYVAQVRWEVTEYCADPAKKEPATAWSASISATSTSSTRGNRDARVNTRSQEPGDPSERNTMKLAEQLGITAEPAPTPLPALNDECFTKIGINQARTVDIIPRQSALNVNSVHQTSSGFALTARFLATFGLGGKVDYQRQREVYDQFVYQDIFASGFGKGSNAFGWTFGPLPGTKALAPGVRTTYAVMVIPSDARRIRIVGKGYAFRRQDLQPAAAESPKVTDTFDIDIPGEDTNGFFLRTADYVPVESGKRVTLVLGGPYFSPQIGVLVNGRPLERSVALAPIDLPSPTPTPPSGSGANPIGEYEYVNSRRLIATFSMGNDYEGTPVISLVTPEKTAIINRYKIQVNHRRWAEDSLELHALLEPMFLAPLAISKVQFIDHLPIGGTKYIRAVVSGKGFRPEGTISVNGHQIDNSAPLATLPDGTLLYPVVQKSTHLYELTFLDPGTPTWDITLRQNSKQGQEETSFQLSRPLAPVVFYDILRYTSRRGTQPARLDLRLSNSHFQKITEVSLLDDGILMPAWPCDPPSSSPAEPAPSSKGGRQRQQPPRGTCTVISGGEVLLTLRLDNDDYSDSLLLLVKGNKGESAILNVLPPTPPTITSIVNDITKKAEGSPDGNYQVIIRGSNLGQVHRVFFGSRAAQIQQFAPGVLTVVVPKGEEGTVRVLLESDTLYQGKFLSNSQDFADKETKAVFTYVKPKPPSP